MRGLLGAACLSCSDAAHAQSGLDPSSQDYWRRSRDEALQSARQRSAQQDEILRLTLIAVNTTGCPIDRADAPFAPFKKVCDDYAKEAEAASKKKGQKEFAKGMKDIVQQCRTKYADLYVEMLGTKYKADFGAVVKQLSAGGDPSAY